MRGGVSAMLGAAALALTVAGAAEGQVSRSTPGQPEARTAVELMPAKGKLTVTSPAFKDGGDIPFANTQYRGNHFPGLNWTKGPAATKSYVIVMQDSSLLLRNAPILHWTMFNIPATVTSLPADMAPDAKPAGSAYGPNYMGAARPYTGPRTPPGPKDHYHFAVFALDTTVPPEAAASYEALAAAMKDHILASGEVVGLGEKDPEAPPPAPRPAAQ
ncbi:MAG: YbhB/YbcL family Raf kinase inhibitor-like protein [Phenylobacterium sp.]|uniref:YbhB/YbcL family Raf kinase inhibitor-like protein n=1 Tax=Phenylobacterium sp. TaxID=1871053 RepID=UPI001A503C01|nr:YbhB/YbcL family Raf kinase inhibitor-like protein [Phenylobacterium sp.]MBL8554051.1 YbhB/YbcL family Raf kinase inhibitor-like protein [Phenylobacterium sp.]